MADVAPVVRLTAAAEARIGALLAKAPRPAMGLRLSTPQRGCSGFGYAIDYVEHADPADETVETSHGILYLDHRSLAHLKGLLIDWQEGDFESGFAFRNPNAAGSCGCGSSFTVDA